MKVIGGKFKGRIIAMPKGIRPTSGKVREALFEILKPRMEDASFLDLYCGSGAIGIESISRGTQSVTFVDNSPGCISLLKKNIASLGILNRSSIDIYHMDAIRALSSISRHFDIVFLDPPYYKDMAKNTLIAISNYDILARNAVVVIEAYKKDDLPEKVGSLTRFRTAKYGDTKLEFYKA